MAIILSSIAGLSTMLGTLVLYIKLNDKKILLSFSLGLALAVMFLVSVLDLIPVSIKMVINDYNFFKIFITSLLYLMLGYLVVGRVDERIDSNDKLYKIGILSMVTLLLHNIPEGIITSITACNNLKLGFRMALLIMLHNIPEGICIALPIYYTTQSKTKAFFYTFISGLGEIVGALLSVFLLKRFITAKILSAILMITSGIMITLSLRKILVEAISYNRYKYLLIGIIVGAVVVFITL